MMNPLIDYIGKTKSQTLIDEIQATYKENFIKKFPDYFEKSYIKSSSIISITQPKETEIKDIGMSCLNDLLVDNYGNMLSGLLGGQAPSVNMKDTGGTDRAITIVGQQGTFTDTDPVGTATVGSKIQVGKGLTPVARTDFNIETPFTGGIPSASVFTGQGGYNLAGKVTVSAVLSPTSQSGSISEACLFNWFNHVVTSRFFMMAHDNISPAVGFIIGQAINVDYQIILS